MKDSKKFMFRVGTIESRAFHVSAGCVHEAIDKAQEYLDEKDIDDFIVAVKMCRAEYIVEDDEEADLNADNKPKLTVVPPDTTVS